MKMRVARTLAGAVLLTMAMAPAAVAGPVTFTFDSLANGANSSAIQTYMNSVLTAGATVTVYAGATAFLSKNEDEFTEFDRLKFEATRWALSKMPRAAKRKMFQAIPAQYQMVACYAGKTEPVHAKIIEKGFQQYAIPVRGQCDILITGIPDISPYNVYSALNPLLVQVMALGYHFNMYRNKPLLRKGGTLILTTSSGTPATSGQASGPQPAATSSR